MELERIQKRGVELFISKENRIDSIDFYTESRQFLIDLLSGIASLSIKYHNRVQIDLPYIYRERQLDSVILPTLSKICNGAVLAELPISRNCHLKGYEIENSKGRIDYWCIYKNFSFIMEVKHSYDECFTNITRERSLVKEWEYMNISQLQSVKDEAKLFEENTDGIIRLGLHFITSYSLKYPTIELVKTYKRNISDILDQLRKEVSQSKPSKTKPDFMACWIPPTSLVINEEWKEFYPGLIMMCKIFKPIIHKGYLK